MKLQGVYPAMVTPLTPDEKVDKAGMRRVVQYCLKGGVHGVVVLGTTGEFPAMTEAMRQDAIEATLDEVNGKVPVLIGCGDSGTQKVLAQVKSAVRTKADGVLVAIPYYFPVDQASVIRHYQAVADASEKPVVLYNFPQMTKITMTPDTMATLAKHPNIIGVKDSAGDFVTMQRYLDVTAEYDFAVTSGNPAVGLAAYEMGATGGIFAGCSLFPKTCVEPYNAFKKGDWTAAVAFQKKASLITLMGGFGPNSAVIKFCLNKLGICGPTVTAPLGLAPGQDEKILAWMRRVGIEAEKGAAV